jgi:Flp pilus assembly pilin Flp
MIQPATPAPHHSAADAPDLNRALFRFVRDENGQAMTEFVIIMPLLLFLVMGIVQFALNAMGSYVLTLGNFYAMRSASVTMEYEDLGISGFSTEDDSTSTARYMMSPAWLVKGDPALTVEAVLSISVTNERDGNNVTTQTEFDFPMVIPIARNVIGVAVNGAEGTFGEEGTAFMDAVNDDIIFIPNNFLGNLIGGALAGILQDNGITTGTKYVRLPMTSNNRFDEEDGRHRMLIARRQY